MIFTNVFKIFLSTLLITLPLTNQISYITTATAQNTRTNTKYKFKTYAIKNVYSIDYPIGWQAARSPEDYYTIITNRTPRYLEHWPYDFIKTDISLSTNSLKTSLKNMNNKSDSDVKIMEQEKIMVNNREAYRFLVSNPEMNLIITLVKYPGNKTASIITFYNPDNYQILPTIYKIHNSFKVLKQKTIAKWRNKQTS